VDILLTFLPPAVLFHLPLLLFLSLDLPAVSLRLPWFLAAARLWPVLRLLGPPSILILLVSILFAVWLILLRMAGTPAARSTLIIAVPIIPMRFMWPPNIWMRERLRVERVRRILRKLQHDLRLVSGNVRECRSSCFP